MADVVPAEAVETLTTIGCPLDIVRLYEPDYVRDRTPSRDGIPWRNVFNPADVMSSNLMNGTDSAIGVTGILITGRMHANYWGQVQAGPSSNCFGPLISAWIPAPPPAPAQP